MDYLSDLGYLKANFDINKDELLLKDRNVIIRNIDFISSLPEYLNEYKANLSGFAGAYGNSEDELMNNINSEHEENYRFKYILIKDTGTARAKDAIFLFHGLNEKSWDKYLPWGLKLHEITGKAIILFPIAYHMNRAPLLWNNPRKMNLVAKKRKENYSQIVNATFANAALSERLDKNPFRFFTSGIQTYFDVIDVITKIKEGNHKYIYDDANLNFFGYSIGGLLAEILLMSNPQSMLEKSKMFIFCGGPTFDIMFPVAKAILDSEAYNSLRRIYVDGFEKCLIEETLSKENNSEVKYFRSLMNLTGLQGYREKRLNELKERIFAVSLSKDMVIPPNSVISTLNGANKKIPIRTMITDFPYDYTHEIPFPEKKDIREIVDVNFRNIMDLAATHFN